MEYIERSQPACQIHYLDQMAQPLGRLERIGQLRYKAKRVLKRRLRYFHNWLSRHSGDSSPVSIPDIRAKSSDLAAGQWVRVRSKAEIKATLDNWNNLRGCGFMEEMWPYCGTKQQVLKPVCSFLDERDCQVKKVKRMVILKGLHCEGTLDYGRCDRNCFFFWREEWLEKIE